MIYSTLDLYGRKDLSELAGMKHPDDLYKRLEWLEEMLTAENDKFTHERNHHLITKIISSKKFWRERIREVE